MNIDKRLSMALALRFLTKEEQLWEYIAVTNYGTRYVPPEKQAHLLALLHQLMKQEQLDVLDLPSRLRQFALIRARMFQEKGPFLGLFSECA